jgi:hypothetical protein
MAGEPTTTIRERWVRATPGPWRWAYAYQCRGTHWCLENDQSAALGATINHHLVTLSTQEYDADDDGNHFRLDETPDFQAIAAAPADIATLFAALDAALSAELAAALSAELAAARALMQALLAQPGIVRTPELDRLMDAYNAAVRGAP